MQDYKKLEIYSQAKKVTKEIYKVTANFPPSELYGITSQLRRAAVSIGANIAEGCGKYGDKDFLRYLHISIGSLREVHYELELAYELDYIKKEEYTMLDEEIDKLGAMLYLFTKRVENKPKTENWIRKTETILQQLARQLKTPQGPTVLLI